MQVKTTSNALPSERRWQGYDWFKLVVAAVLAASLIRFGPGTPAAVAPTAVSPTSAPTVGAVTLPASIGPTIDPLAAGILAGPVTLSGTGVAGGSVRVQVNGTEVGTAAIGDDGRWTLDTTLEGGASEIVADGLDAAGAFVAASDPLRVTIGAGASAIAAPTIDPIAGDLIAGPVSITGTGEPGSRVRVTINGVDAGTADVGADGRWSIDTVLPAGSMAIVAESLDTAGAAGAASAQLDITVSARGASGTVSATATTAPTSATAPAATTAPASTAAPAGTTVPAATTAPASTASPVVGGPLAITAPEEGAAIQPGSLTVRGTGSPGTELEVLDSDRVAGAATVGDDGTWSADVELQAGSAVLSVREKGSSEIAGRPIRVTAGTAEASSCTTLAVNCQAFVTRAGSLTLRMRSSPKIADGNIIARLPIGSEMTLLEGPTPNSGFSWWRVRTRGGNEGWVAGENLVLQPD